MLENRYGPLLAVVLATVAAQSLIDVETAAGSMVIHALGGSCLLLAVRAAAVSRRWRRAADWLVGIVLAMNLLLLAASSAFGSDPGRGPELAWVVAVVLVPVTVARRLFGSPEVTVQTMMGAIAAYLQIAVAFAFLYQAIDVLGATPLFGHEVPSTAYMYVSLETISTLGYGDLIPATDLGRLVAMTEAIGGQVFLVTLVAFLVSRFAATHRSDVD